jgi:carbonic anhydrase
VDFSRIAAGQHDFFHNFVKLLLSYKAAVLKPALEALRKRTGNGSKRPTLKLQRKLSMSKILQEVLAANQTYAANFDKGGLAMPPARGFAILTCMDARLHPSKYAGLSEGDAHVIRNAGGRASDDAIRSLIISHKLLGTHEWFVIHHTNCGMETFTNEIMSDLLAKSLDTATIDASGWHDIGQGPGSDEGKYINWLTIKNQAGSVLEDVKRIRSHALVPHYIPIYGFVYDVATGKLIEVPAAMAAGRAA